MQYLMLFLFLWIGYGLCWGNIIKSMDADYIRIQFPQLFMVGVIMVVIFAISFIVSTFGLFSLYILFRLQSMMKQNPSMAKALSPSKYKCFNCFIYFGIFLEFMMGLTMIWNVYKGDDYKIDEKERYQRNLVTICLSITWCIVDLTIHGTLLYGYLKELFKCSQHCYQKNMEDQVHEITIEITRYSVLFCIYMSMIVILNVVLVIVNISWRYKWLKSQKNEIDNTIFLLCLVTRDIGSLIILFFSFKFSYVWYKDRFCGTCDDKMRNYCKKRVEAYDCRDSKRTALLSMQENY